MDKKGRGSLLQKSVNISTGHPFLTLLSVLVIAIIFIIPASQLRTNTSMDSFFGDDPNIEKYTSFTEEFGNQELITVVVDCSKSNYSVAEAYLTELKPALEGTGWFKEIRYTHNMESVGESAILYLPKEHLNFLLDPNSTSEIIEMTYERMMGEFDRPNYYVSENGDIYLLNMNINITLDDMAVREEVFEGLYNILEEVRERDPKYKDLDVGYTGGMLVVDYEADKMAMNDVFTTAVITFLLIFILLIFSFRSLSIPMLAVIPLIVGIIITAGIIQIIFGSLGMMSMSFAVLLLGLGVDFSIHLLTRFMDEMGDHNDINLAFKHTFVHTGKGVILGCLTTTTAFGALYFGKAQAMQEMGIISVMGLLITLLSVFFILPALVTVRLKFGKLKNKMVERKTRFGMLKGMGHVSTRFAVIFIIVMLIIGGFFAFKVPDAKLSSDIGEMQPKTIPTYIQLEKVKNNFNYTEDYLLCAALSFDELVSNVDGLRTIPEVMEVESILDFLPDGQEEKLRILEQATEIHPGLSNLTWMNIEAMTWEDLPGTVKENWVSISDDGLKFLVRIKTWGDIYDEEYRDELIPKLKEVDEDIVAQALLWPKLIDAMTEDVVRVSIIASIPIMIIVYIGFRKLNPMYMILALVPVAFGVTGILALYEYVGVSLNFVSILTIPLVIGIGIDDGIHVIHRYLEEGKGSIPLVIQNVGKAIFLTTATTCLAFSSFMFAEHPSMMALGRVPVLGLSICFLASVLFLPALMKMTIDRKR